MTPFDASTSAVVTVASLIMTLSPLTVTLSALSPPLPEQVIRATTTRYREAYHRLTGHELPEDR